MAEKVTVMKLKVDLHCPSCYKKVKKILCKFPQIRDQVYDEKQNLVTITVVCCSPEKIRDKLCCKGGKVIKSIEIVVPPPPKPPKKPEKPKEPEKPKAPPEKPPAVVADPNPIEPTKPKQVARPVEPEMPKHSRKPQPLPPAVPVPAEPCPYPAVPVGFYCVPCSEGHGGGPCYYGYGYGRPVPSPPCYHNYGYGYGYEKGYSRCDYFSEENTGGCSIM